MAPVRFRMPAEWEPHEATWLAWPHHVDDWPGKFAPVPWVYCDIIKKLTSVERVRLLVPDDSVSRRVRRMLTKAGANVAAVDFVVHATNRSWTRDFCPIFVRDEAGVKTLTDWHFNGWAKYDNWQLDDATPAAVAERYGIARTAPEWNGRRVVLEGGSIDVNGKGWLLTTEECLISKIQERNPGLERGGYEAVFREFLGIEKTFWLRHGIAGDDTHGHVDDLARFVDEQTVVTVVEDDPKDVNYDPLQENLRVLQGCKELRIETLPMPKPIFFEGQRLPASYANFYIANGLVLMPTFNDPNDRVALDKLAKLFPRHTVTGVHCLDLVLGLGTLHCMTQQEPTG